MTPVLTSVADPAKAKSQPFNLDFDFMVSRIERWERTRRNTATPANLDRVDAVYAAALGLTGLCHAFGLLADVRQHSGDTSVNPYGAHGLFDRVCLIVDAMIIEANGQLALAYGPRFPLLPVRPDYSIRAAEAA